MGDAPGGLGPDENEYISERDTFYMASLGETGWPYVQHRGGPKGFLKVIDNNTLAFADFSGNKQYISTGNLIIYALRSPRSTHRRVRTPLQSPRSSGSLAQLSDRFQVVGKPEITAIRLTTDRQVLVIGVTGHLWSP